MASLHPQNISFYRSGMDQVFYFCLSPRRFFYRRPGVILKAFLLIFKVFCIPIPGDCCKMSSDSDSIGLGWHLQICISHSAWVMLMILMLMLLLVGGPQFQKWVSRFSSSHHQPIPPMLTWYVSILLARSLLGSWWRETVIQWDAY